MSSEVAKFIELHTGVMTPDSLVEFSFGDYRALIKACKIQMTEQASNLGQCMSFVTGDPEDCNCVDRKS